MGIPAKKASRTAAKGPTFRWKNGYLSPTTHVNTVIAYFMLQLASLPPTTSLNETGVLLPETIRAPQSFV